MQLPVKAGTRVKSDLKVRFRKVRHCGKVRSAFNNSHYGRSKPRLLAALHQRPARRILYTSSSSSSQCHQLLEGWPFSQLQSLNARAESSIKGTTPNMKHLVDSPFSFAINHCYYFPRFIDTKPFSQEPQRWPALPHLHQRPGSGATEFWVPTVL